MPSLRLIVALETNAHVKIRLQGGSIRVFSIDVVSWFEAEYALIRAGLIRSIRARGSQLTPARVISLIECEKHVSSERLARI